MPFTTKTEYRVAQLLAGGMKSTRQIAAQLAAEGLPNASQSSVARMLKTLREPTKSAKAPAAPAPAPMPELAELEPESFEADPYVPDDEAIDGYVDALGEYIDRAVDEGVSRELADAESLASRWHNRAAVAGWPMCTSCGQHVKPSSPGGSNDS